ncbi:MAG: M20/M25/M40 family metallo-hydrolase [Candidatus Thorarchaeota archaeon]
MSLDTVELLTRLIAIDTVSNLPENKRPTKECPTFILSVLDALGFETKLLESEGVYTAFAKRGTGKFKILFLAHFDVVPPGDGWQSDPFTLRLDGDRAYGRGTCDDKGNVVVLLHLAEQVAAVNPDCTVMIAATGDEEVGGRHGAAFLRKQLEEWNLLPDYVVIADGIHQQVIHRRRNALPAFVRARRRIERVRGTTETIRFETEIFGTESRHSAYIRLGVDRHCMLAASKYLDLHPEVLVAGMRGNFVKSNVIPDWVELDIVHPDTSATETEYDVTLTFLMRSLLPLTRVPFPTRVSDKGTTICPNLLSEKDGIWELYCDIRAMTNDGGSIREAFKSVLNGWDLLESITVSNGVGYVDCDVDSNLVRSAKLALEKVGIPVRLVEGFGASDSRYFADPRIQLFDFGPEGNNLHGPNEWVSISSIRLTADFFLELIKTLL